MRAKPVMISCAKSFLISTKRALVDDRVDDRHHVERLVLVGRDDLLERDLVAPCGGARLGRAARLLRTFCGMNAR